MVKRLLKWLGWCLSFILVGGIFCFYLVENKAASFVSYNANALPACHTALVLGTAKWLKAGGENPYYSYRMQAAASLYQRGKSRIFILSGDNRRNDYNEPMMMKQSLLKLGIPDSALVADYAGLRTFDSMVRASEIFGQDSLMVVSQRFHTIRAVFIARARGITAFGYNASEVHNIYSLRILFREFFSRIRCVLDVYILDTKPRHLGEKIRIS